MGASYTCIITKEKLSITAETPHFVKNGIITIPINCGFEGAKNFSEHFNNGRLEHLDELEDDENHPQIVLALLESVNLTHGKYLLDYMAEWADIPCEGYSAAFESGNVVSGSVWEMCVTSALIDIYKWLGLDRQNDVHLSHGYNTAKKEYLETINE